MKLFRGKSAKHQQPNEPVEQAEESIGSELSTRDQFDIIVRKSSNNATANRTLSKRDQPKNGNRSLLSYFSNDAGSDNSTVSSITLDDRHRRSFNFFHSSRQSVDSGRTSWCCCADNTEPTEFALTDANTLMLSTRSYRSGMGEPYTQERYRAIQEQQMHQRQKWYNGCAPECVPEAVGTKSKMRRPRLFRGGKSMSKTSGSIMSSSLFDTLSEDWDDEEGGRTRKSVMRRGSMKLRRTLTFNKRKPTPSAQ